MSDTPKTDNLCLDLDDGFAGQSDLIAFARDLERENADLHDTLDAVIAADERAVDLWRAAHPGNELVVPDRARLVGWLLEQNAALRAVAIEVCALARVWATVWGDKLSAESIQRLGELEQQILKEAQP